jgi:hypothetical protein
MSEFNYYVRLLIYYMRLYCQWKNALRQKYFAMVRSGLGKRQGAGVGVLTATSVGRS